MGKLPTDSHPPHLSLAGLLILSLLGAAVIWQGVFPAWLVSLVGS